MTDHPLLQLDLTRRHLLRLGAAGVAGTAVAGALTGLARADIRDRLTIPVPDMTPLDPDTIDRSEWGRQEQRIARYFVSLAEIANNMEDTDPDTVGWFNGGYSVYQPPRITTFMARLQEIVYTLAFFYTHDAPWNHYRLDPVLRDHIYAAMSHYIRIQNADGSWAANAPGEKNRAVVAFALVYFGGAATMLESVGWDAQVRAEALSSLTKAAEYFTDPTVTDIRVEGMKVSNQVIGGLEGIRGLLPLLPQHLRARYDDLLDAVVRDGQSPQTGSLYESSGFDAHYSLYTSIPDLGLAYEASGDDRYRQLALRHLEFCQWNFLWEPDGAGFTVNGISTRLVLRSLVALRGTDTSAWPDTLNVFAESPVARALNWHAEHLTALQDAWYAGDVPVAKLGASEVSPANNRLTEQPPAYPTLAQRQAAIATFPYFRSDAFVEARTDSRHQQSYLYVNRPGYWFSGHHGARVAAKVFRGPSVFFRHDTGAWVTTQMSATTNPNLATDCYWGTRLHDGSVDVAQPVTSTGTPVGIGTFSVTYADSGARVRTTVTCRDHEVGLSVRTPAEASFTHRVPLVVKSDDVVTLITPAGEQPAPIDGTTVDALGIRVRRGQATFEVSTGSRQLSMSLTRSSVRLFSGAAARDIVRLDVAVPSGALDYALRILPDGEIRRIRPVRRVN